jgi:hypothetical protein
MSKVQGEGDYESARRYNTRTRRFVDTGKDATTVKKKGGVDAGALRKAKSRAKRGDQDARDARVFRTLTAGK